MRFVLRLAVVVFAAPLFSACNGGAAAPPPMPATPPGAVTPHAVDVVPQAAVIGVTVHIHLPLRDSDGLDALISRQADKGSPDYHHFLTPEQFRARYAPSAHDLATAAATMRGLGFTTLTTSQTVIATAPQATVERAFNVSLRSVQTHERATASAAARGVLTTNRAPTLPAALTRLGATVGFSAGIHHVDSRRVSTTPYNPTPQNRYSNVGPYWFTDLKQAYGYPAYQVANGAGRTIAIVIDSDVLDSDLAMYFGHEHLAPPSIERRPVDGGPGPFDPNSGGAGEASLDVQMAFGSAPGSRILLYGVPTLSDQNTLDAYTAIVDENRADIVNSSFGLCELYYTAAYNGGTDFTSILQQFHDVFRQGNAQGITFVTSSGDNGAYDCFDPSGTFLVKGVENPADDPDSTAVGGTNLITASAAGSLNSSYLRESAFADPQDPAQGALPNQVWGSGGGESVVFTKPWYQHLVQTRSRGRTVPDVAMHMGGCPFGSLTPCNPDDSSVVTAIGGSFFLLIGTSASSPEFAGLLAVTEQTLGTRLGNANGYIYLTSGLGGELVYRQDIPGNNGLPANHDYNEVLGNGTPHAAVFAAQPFAPRAGNPQTPSNP